MASINWIGCAPLHGWLLQGCKANNRKTVQKQQANSPITSKSKNKFLPWPMCLFEHFVNM